MPRVENWNGRYYQHGQGAGGGIIDLGALAGFVRDGAVGAATDDGNRFPWPGARDLDDAYQRSAKARDSPEEIIDNWYRGSEETTRAEKSIIHAYYGRAQQYSYFEGCSGGGTHGWQAAQRFPDEWNGLVIGAPANNTTGFFAANAWNSRMWLDPQARIPSAKLPAIQQASIASCSREARLRNGTLGDPRFCHFGPSVVPCKDQETDDCLTRPQISTLRKIYEGPRNPRTGEAIYPGFPPTMESGWKGFLTNTSGGRGVFYEEPFSLFSANINYRYVFDNPQWDVRMFNFDRSRVHGASKDIGREFAVHYERCRPGPVAVKEAWSEGAHVFRLG